MLHWNDELEPTEREQDEARRLIKASFAKDIAKANTVLAKIENEAPCPERESRVERARSAR